MRTAEFILKGSCLKKQCLVFRSVICFTLLTILFLTNCSFLLLDESSPVNISFKRSSSLLLVVEEGLESSLKSSLATYQADLNARNLQVYTYLWNGGTAADLKKVLSNYYQINKIDGAFLIGNLPTSWYEMTAFEAHEEFPCDLFYMDLDSTWQDNDQDGLYDSHSPLTIDIYTSRIMGTSDELIKYFDKVHRFRTGALRLDASAYIFKDDDWAYYNQGYAFGLEQIYRNISFCERIDDTVKPTYVSSLTTGGAEFVYQWIHSHPSSLCVQYQDQYQYINTNDIKVFNFKGLFFNLFDCSASRFTQDCLAMSYLTKTDYALATLGSTKVGGNYYPLSFNITLSRSGTWGDAFRVWYNYYGVKDDSWFLGMMILGDPLLKTTNKKDALQIFSSLSVLPPPGTKDIKGLEEKLRKANEFAADSQDFQEYKALNPQFYQ